jgi:hypothetical protein
MKNGQLVGLVAVNTDGEVFGQVGASLVCGVSRELEFYDFLVASGAPEFVISELYSEEIFKWLDENDGPFAFDPEAHAVFFPIAQSRLLPPTGSFEFGFTDNAMRPYVIYSSQYSNN